MKTESEIQNVINWLGVEDADDPCDDLPYIENIRAFKEALLWVLKPCAVLTKKSSGQNKLVIATCSKCGLEHYSHIAAANCCR